MPSLYSERKNLSFFAKRIDLRNVPLKECSTAICVVRCLSFILNAKRRGSIRITFTRKSYSKEKKIKVIQWHHEIEETVSMTAKTLSNDCKQVRSLVKEEESILQINSRSKTKHCAKEKYPLMEKKLHKEFLELSKKGASGKRCWFTL